MEFLISAIVLCLVLCGVLLSLPYWPKCCKKCANKKLQPQEDSFLNTNGRVWYTNENQQPQFDSSINENYVNFVYLPNESIVEIPSENTEITNNRLPSYSVNNLHNDMPPSYIELFGKA